MRLKLFIQIILLVSATSGHAKAVCSQALVLALDISGSVNDVEYNQQLNGLAGALLAPEISDLILSTPETPVSVAVFEWSSADHQQLIQDWLIVDTPESLAQLANRIRAHRKNRVTLKTALGSAIEFANVLLSEKTHCWRRTIDISGDGKNNDGPEPLDVKIRLQNTGIIVNALVIADPKETFYEYPFGGKLIPYFKENVTFGPGAFVEEASGYKDYLNSMRRKLERELSPVIMLGAIDRKHDP
ncbi:MAG: DUF1194 domain-containing protein [Paracoccaceae bacterium]|nr:DUF1194 domain-containing protein [Paracoccaceae bacterium]